MKLSERERQAYDLGWVESQVQSAPVLAASLRAMVTAARADATAATGIVARLRAAVLWEVTEAWCGRLERAAADLERQGTERANDAQQRRAALARVSRWPWNRKV